MRTLRLRKGKDPNRGHTAAAEGLEPLASCFLGRSCFPSATVALPPQQPPARVTTIWPSMAFPVLVPLCGQGLGFRSRKPGVCVGEGQLEVRDR